MFYNGFKGFEGPLSPREGAETLDFDNLNALFCAEVCISSFWATFWSAIKEGNASNAQNLVLQWEIKGFWAPPSPREGAETLDLDHLNTPFLRRSVHFIILGNFSERYQGRKWVQRSKPSFTM